MVIDAARKPSQITQRSVQGIPQVRFVTLKTSQLPSFNCTATIYGTRGRLRSYSIPGGTDPVRPGLNTATARCRWALISICAFWSSLRGPASSDADARDAAAYQLMRNSAGAAAAASACRIGGGAASTMRTMSAASFSRLDRSNGSFDHTPPKVLNKPTSASVTATARTSVTAKRRATVSVSHGEDFILGSPPAKRGSRRCAPCGLTWDSWDLPPVYSEGGSPVRRCFCRK